jgi:hydroxyacylglutathione hydrolase
LKPVTSNPLPSSQLDLQARQVHIITDRFAMANAYILNAEQLVVVDPRTLLHVNLLQGYIERILRRSLSDIALIVLTNVHEDQSAGLEMLRRLCMAPVAASAEMQYIVQSQRRALQAFPHVLRNDGLLPPIFERQLRHVRVWLTDGERLPVNTQWEVIVSSGHSPDSLCLYNPFTAELVCSDTVLTIERRAPILRKGVDRYALEQMLHLLRSLRVNYVYPGHGRSLLARRPLENLHFEW